MKKLIFVVLFVSSLIYARTYEVPPTSSNRGSVPVISDEKMKECVKLYNKANWLADEINSMYLNQYDISSVNTYNRKRKQ